MSKIDLMALYASPLAEATNISNDLQHDILWLIIYGGLEIN